MRLLSLLVLLALPLMVRANDGELDPPPDKLVVVTWNVEWMFDHDQSDNKSDLSKQQSAPSAEYWQWKVAAVAKAIANTGAHIVCLQEIEGSQTLADIAKELRDQHHQTYRAAFIQAAIPSPSKMWGSCRRAA